MALLTKAKHDKNVTMSDILAATREQIVHIDDTDNDHGIGSTDEAGRSLHSA